MKKKEVLAAIGIFIALWGLFAVFTARLREPSDNYVFDFFPRWYGTRQVFLEGSTNPYNVRIERSIQDHMEFEEYQPHRHNFLYPATIMYILLPFWLLPWAISISLWAGLTLTLFLVLPLIVSLMLGWRIPPLLLLPLTFCSTFLFRHSIHNYLFGQFLIFIAASWMLSWWATVHRKPFLSAIALIFSTVRPEGAIISGSILFDLLLKQRFKTVAIWTSIMAGLLALSFLQLGWWVDDMLIPLRGYDDCCLTAYPPSEMPAARFGEIVFTLIIVLWAAWMLIQMRKLPDLTRIPWSLSTIIVAYLLIFPQSKDYTLVYALIPLWVSLWSSRGHWLTSIVVLAILISPWIYFKLEWTLPNENPKEQFLTPIFTGIVLTIHWWRWSQAQIEANTDTSPKTATSNSTVAASNP